MVFELPVVGHMGKAQKCLLIFSTGKAGDCFLNELAFVGVQSLAECWCLLAHTEFFQLGR